MSEFTEESDLLAVQAAFEKTISSSVTGCPVCLNDFIRLCHTVSSRHGKNALYFLLPQLSSPKIIAHFPSAPRKRRL